MQTNNEKSKTGQGKAQDQTSQFSQADKDMQKKAGRQPEEEEEEEEDDDDEDEEDSEEETEDPSGV